MQRLAIGGLAVLFSLLPVAGLCGERPLRIVTFNVQCLQAPDTNKTRLSRFRWSPAREAHLEAIAGVIETLEPDICALTEVTGSESVDRLIDILHRKGLGQYRGHHVESQDRFTGFDVAFITRTTPDAQDGALIRHFAPRGPIPTGRRFTRIPTPRDNSVRQKSRSPGTLSSTRPLPATNWPSWGCISNPIRAMRGPMPAARLKRPSPDGSSNSKLSREAMSRSCLGI